MNTKAFATLTILALGAGVAAAQDLKTEVVVDRTVEPAERAATRLSGLTPEVVLPVFQAPSIRQSIYTRLSPLTRTYTRLDPAAGIPAAEPSPYRGYAAIGYFPTLNLGLAAGYRFLDSERFSLGASVNFNGERYKSTPSVGTERHIQSMLPSVDVDFAWRPDSRSTLSASAGYRFISQETALWEANKVNSGCLSLGWASETGGLRYSVGVKAAFEKSGDTKPVDAAGAVVPGVGQQVYGFAADASLPVGGVSRFGIGLEGEFVHTGAITESTYAHEASTLGAVGITPFYDLASGNLSARVGVKVDLGVGGEGSKVHVMPDMRLQWAALPQFSVWADVSGGTVMNTFSSLRQITVYQLLSHDFGRSDIPVAADLGFNFGPFAGFSASLFGGYAVANEWLMASGEAVNPYLALDVKGWHAGVALAYEWKMVRVDASAEFSPSDYDRAWFSNYDRASSIVRAGAEVKPIERLTVGVGYEFRGGRKAYSAQGAEYGLGCVSDLKANAAFKVSDACSVFARVENLLGRKYDIMHGLPSQGVHGLVGVEVKF